MAQFDFESKSELLQCPLMNKIKYSSFFLFYLITKFITVPKRATAIKVESVPKMKKTLDLENRPKRKIFSEKAL